MAGLQPHLVPGERRGMVLVCHGYRYQKNRTIAGLKIYWRCSVPACRVPIQTNDFDPDGDIIVLDNHYTQSTHINLKMKDLTDLTFFGKSSPSSEETHQFQPEEHMSKYSSHSPTIEGSMFLYSKKFEVPSSAVGHRYSPPLPRTIARVNIQGTWAETWEGERKLLAIDNDVGVAIFSSRRELQILGQCNEVYIDGTFRTAPAPYTQIVTIHGRYHGWVLALGMCMVTGKREDQYRYILQEIKRGVLDATELPFAPQMVITDFEVGLINAIRTELPNARSRGCYFHFCQSLWRKITELGLKVAYNVDPLVQMVVGKILSLGHLPAAHVAMNFLTYTNSRHVQEMVQQYPALQAFFEYVDQTYVHGPVFTVHFWNVYNRSMETRTNNYCEAFHNRWNRSVMIAHPNIWRVIRRIKDEGSRTLNMLRRAERGDRQPRRRKKWRDLERRIIRLRREFERGDRNLLSFWDAAVHFSKSYI